MPRTRTMMLNGESPEQMERIREGGLRRSDMTHDDPWPGKKSLFLMDVYVNVVAFGWQAVKLVILLLPTALLFLPLCLTAACRSRGQPPQLLAWALMLPALIAMALSLILDSLIYWLAFGPLLLWPGHWARYCRGRQLLKCWSGGPPIWRHFRDYVTALTGQVHRRGPVWMATAQACTMLMIPVVKYFIHANVLAYDLSERFVNQIGRPEKLGTEVLAETLTHVVETVHLEKDIAQRLRSIAFVAHYPAPPIGADRRWALGMQSVRCRWFKLGSWVVNNPGITIVHTTHNLSTNGGSTEQTVLSSASVQGLWRIMLWYNNPFHPFVGYVEFNLASFDGALKMEHPMWLVASHGPIDSSHWQGPSWVDDLFQFHVLPEAEDEVARETGVPLAEPPPAPGPEVCC